MTDSLPTRRASEQELRLVGQVETLKQALQAGLDFIDHEYGSEAPPYIRRLFVVLEEPPAFDMDDVDQVGEFRELVTLMGLFMNRASALVEFGNGQAGLLHWVILYTAALNRRLPDRRFSRLVGATPRQVLRSLELMATLGLVVLRPIDERSRMVEVTDLGQAALAEVRQKVSDSLSTFAAAGPLKIASTALSLRMLLRLFDGKDTVLPGAV